MNAAIDVAVSDRFVPEPTVGKYARHDAEAFGLVGVDGAAGHDHVEGPGGTDEPRQEVGDAGVGSREAGADERRAERRRRCRDAQVTAERQREAAAEGGAVDCCEHDLWRGAQVLHEVGEVALPVLTGGEVSVTARCRDLAPVLEVEAGAERTAGSGEDDDLAVVVGGNGVEGIVQLADEGEVDGVEALGAVEAESGDMVGDRFDEDGGHGVQWAARPPSAMTTCPVMKLPASEQRSSAGPTISSGWAARRMKAARCMASTRSGAFARTMSVSTVPGASALTRIPSFGEHRGHRPGHRHEAGFGGGVHRGVGREEEHAGRDHVQDRRVHPRPRGGGVPAR